MLIYYKKETHLTKYIESTQETSFYKDPGFMEKIGFKNKLYPDIYFHTGLLNPHAKIMIENSKFTVINSSILADELVKDLNVKNENILRTYRLYKNSVKTEQYIKVSMSRMERRTMALLRSGTLPIAIETDRYSRPPTPVDDRLCDLCDMEVVENEKHFFLDCPLYSDVRYNLYYECSKYIDIFYTLNNDDTFIYMMYCTVIQHYFYKCLRKFYIRRSVKFMRFIILDF